MVKQLFKRFRAWQREPSHYKPLTDENHVCLNCGLTFVGNYCPRCMQSAKTRKYVGWHTLLDGVKDTFDMETGSLIRTLLHLLLRPGYLISEYLSGKRKVCTPPLNTFIMVSVLNIMVRTLVGPVTGTAEPSISFPEEGHLFIDTLREWGKNNSWVNTIDCVFTMLTTWVLFRHSPRHPRHTLVEGFFIQVFMIMLLLLFDIVIVIGGMQNSLLLLILCPLYYMFALGPIFGYNWWGTLWRSVAVIYTGIRLYEFPVSPLTSYRAINSRITSCTIWGYTSPASQPSS